jgi:AcrR family transcriptional regulator
LATDCCHFYSVTDGPSEFPSGPAPSRRPPTRRTEGSNGGARAARVIDDVLQATAEALASKGYGALRIDDVAARSGVNKTTIYRRWPTKADLVAATLTHLRPASEPLNTGSLRDDLLAMLRETLVMCSSPIGRGITRMLQTERADPEVERMTRGLRDSFRALREQAVQAAIARGELPAGTSARLIVDMVFSPITLGAVIRGETLDDADAVLIVDTVLAGARALGTRG